MSVVLTNQKLSLQKCFTGESPAGPGSFTYSVLQHMALCVEGELNVSSVLNQMLSADLWEICSQGALSLRV